LGCGRRERTGVEGGGNGLLALGDRVLALVRQVGLVFLLLFVRAIVTEERC
jgi:hypothetical protein